MPPPKRVKMGAFYRVLRLMELAAEFGYTTVSIPADLFDEIRQWDAEALGQLRAAIEEAIRTDARQRQTAATEAGTTAEVGTHAGDASADLPESEAPGNQESEAPGNQERWT